MICCSKLKEAESKHKIIYSEHFKKWITCFDGQVKYDEIDYCPFCGIKLE